MSGLLEDASRYTLTFGQAKIPFELAFRSKRRLSITVLPNRNVVVLAPKGHELDKVLALVQKRASWIVKKRNYFEQFHPFPNEKRFVSGETHLYLGRQYRLKLLKRENADVKLVGRYFYVSAKNPNHKDFVKTTLDDWYMEKAEKLFSNRVKHYLESVPSLRLTPSKITIQRMAKRWGSCTKAGNILLNLDLIKAPLHCIEYVIAHELCHLKIHDHSPDFYRLLARCMPDWKQRKIKLDAFML